jgi:hypothetical protein
VFPCSDLRLKQIESKAAQYNVHQLMDGTLINLYHHAGTWRLGSARASDLTDLAYSTTATFGQLFDEVLGAYPDFGYERLDKTRTYTIGFSHPAMHSTTTEMRAWTYYDEIGIPKPEMTPLERPARLQALVKQCRTTPYTHESNLLGYVLVPNTVDAKCRTSYVIQTRLWKLISSCQNHQIPISSVHIYSKRDFMIARTLVAFHELGKTSRDAAKLRIAKCMPGLAAEVAAFEQRIAAADGNDSDPWVANVLTSVKPLTPAETRDRLLTSANLPFLAVMLATDRVAALAQGLDALAV